MKKTRAPWTRCIFACYLLLSGWALLAEEAPFTSVAQRASSYLWDALSSYGSITVLPLNNWASGDWEALNDSLWGYNTPRVNQLRVDMEQTITTVYEGGLFFKKLNLGLGATVRIDNNVIGKINQIMGFLQYQLFEVRVEFSRLKGTAYWLGNPIPGLPQKADFDNSLNHVDLLYYLKDGMLYIGLGYSAYQMPVQINCLVWDSSRGSVWWAPVVSFYQRDMKFSIYSFLLGFDTLHQALVGNGMGGAFAEGFGPYVWTQDRFGVGYSTIDSQTRQIIETMNQRTLWSASQIAMMVDYNLTVGIQYVKHFGRFHLGAAVGYNVGGQIVSCITSKGTVKSGYVDASPSLYLFHHGPMIKASILF